MKNYKMIVSYDGTRYSGWEHQPGKDLTIQGKLESVLEAMETGEHPDAQPRRITVIGAGRTDAGVHARAMTCNVLLETDKTEEEIQAYMNRYLPDDISVNEVRIWPTGFTAASRPSARRTGTRSGAARPSRFLTENM